MLSVRSALLLLGPQHDKPDGGGPDRYAVADDKTHTALKK